MHRHIGIHSNWHHAVNRHLVAITLCAALLTGVTLLLSGTVNARTRAAELPAGFRVTPVTSGLTRPTDFVFLPDGRLLVTQLGEGRGEAAFADVVLVENGIIRPNPALTLSVMRENDSGLLAIVLDPDFADDGSLYLWYAPGANAQAWDGNRHVRLSRFTWNAATATIDPQSEQVLLQTALWDIWHHGNSLEFDAEGNLWVAVGEITEGAAHTQDVATIEGKILRIRPNSTGYTIPVDNPYINDPDARPEIYAIGFRNPYMLTQRASDGMVAVADVGAFHHEEINILQSGSNYGWPEREGVCPRGQYVPCEPAPPQYTDPLVHWRHDLAPVANGGAITGLAFYEGSQFPPAFDGKLFYTDLPRQFLRVADPQTGETEPFGSDMGFITRLRVYAGQLYYLNAYTGALNAIYYEESANVAPSVALSADTQNGTPPLRVAFTAAASDPDDTVLNFRWDFGDGTPVLESAESTLTHVYATDGRYTASVTAVDARGAASLPAELPITLYSGEWPRIFVDNQTEPERTRYHAGDTVAYRAERSTLTDLDPDTPFSWRVVLHHGTHTHDIISSVSVSDTFTIPTDNHDGSTDLWYEFLVTMRTADGIEIELSKEIEPALTQLTFTTAPVAHRLEVNGVEVAAPHSIEAIVGIENQAIALPDMYKSPDFLTPARWFLDNVVTAEGDAITIFAPADPARYTASYIFDRRGPQLFAPLVTQAETRR